MTYWSRKSKISFGFGSSSHLSSELSESSSSMISLHKSMHSSQMYTPGPAMSFLTCFCDLPQNEHFSRSPPSPIRATYVLPASSGPASRLDVTWSDANLRPLTPMTFPVCPPSQLSSVGGHTGRRSTNGTRSDHGLLAVRHDRVNEAV